METVSDMVCLLVQYSTHEGTGESLHNMSAYLRETIQQLTKLSLAQVGQSSKNDMISMPGENKDTSMSEEEAARIAHAHSLILQYIGVKWGDEYSRSCVEEHTVFLDHEFGSNSK